MTPTVYDPEEQRVRIETEVAFLKTMKIGDRAVVTFKSRIDDRGRLVKCEPFAGVGEIVGLDLYEGRGFVNIHFDGDRVPTGPFSPLDIKLIETPDT